jgi:hypothetical protein
MDSGARSEQPLSMWLLRLWVLIVVVLVGCRDLTLPPTPPAPGVGTVQGTLLYAVPGRTERRPAAGARVSLLGSSIEVVALESGRFLLAGVRSSEGQLLIQFDQDADGTFERQRVFELGDLGAGLGREVELGEVLLGRTATVVGRALREDRPGLTGHVGSAVFVASAPYLTTTGDDGSFVFEGLPEGPVSLSFFRDGFATEGLSLTLLSGQETQLAPVTLRVAPPGEGRLAGVVRAEGNGVGGARVTVAAGGSERQALTADDGRYEFIALRTGLYQVGIELPGYTSARLFNVLVSVGENEAPAVDLVAGASMRLSLDGGAPLFGDDAGAVGVGLPVARIDPLEQVVAPGAVVTLTGARSSGGEAPLNFQWRTRQDAGVQFAPTAQARDTSFLAPDASVAIDVELVVADANLRTSTATAVVRVGRAPQLTVNAPATVRAGETVLLTAMGVSTDGTALTYQWRQRTGPVVPEFALALGSSVVWTAPSVVAAVPISLDVVAISSVGIETSTRVSLIVEPAAPWRVVVDVFPDAGAIYGVDGGNLVRLTPRVLNPPTGVAFTFAWQQPCPHPCALTLFASDAGEAEFVTPPFEGNQPNSFSVQVSLRRGLSVEDGGTVTTQVQFSDQRPPTCQVSVSPLALRVDCDETIVDAGVDIPGRSHTVFVSRQGPRALFDAPDAGPTGTWSAVVQDRAGNVTSLGGTTAGALQFGPVVASARSSDAPPDAEWVFLPGSQGQPDGTWLVGRRTDTSSPQPRRFISRVAIPFSCMSSRCVETPIDSNEISGAPMRLPVRAVVSTGAQLVVAPSDGNEVFEWRNNAFVEVRAAMQFRTFGIAADGSLVLLTTSDMALNELSWWSAPTNGTAFVRQGPVSSDSVGPDTVVNFEELGAGGQVVTGIDQSGNVFRLHWAHGSAGWVSLPPFIPLTGVTGVTALKTASTWDGVSVRSAYALRHSAGASLEVEGTTTTFSIPLNSATTDFDVIAFGSGSLALAVSENQLIRLGIVDRSTGTITQLSPSTNTLEGWNGTTQNASRPRLSLIDGQIGLSWQEGVMPPYTMAGRVIR